MGKVNDSLDADKKEGDLFSKIKPKITEYNKPILNRVQTVALFKLLRDKGILNKDIKNIHLAQAIMVLTGYAHEPIRRDLSVVDIGEIVSKRKHLVGMQAILKDLTYSIEKIIKYTPE